MEKFIEKAVNMDEILEWADSEMNRLEGIGLTDNQIYIIKEVMEWSKGAK